jgi:hypothetical protein
MGIHNFGCEIFWNAVILKSEEERKQKLDQRKGWKNRNKKENKAIYKLNMGIK